MGLINWENKTIYYNFMLLFVSTFDEFTALRISANNSAYLLHFIHSFDT